MTSRILVVDDSITIQKVIKLACAPYEVSLSYASSFLEAMSLVDEVRPSVVIADANIPGAHGPQDFTKLSQAGGKVPIVILSGSYEEFDEVAFRREGFGHFLKKPFDVGDVVKVVNQVGDILEGYAAIPTSAHTIHTEAIRAPSDGGVSAVRSPGLERVRDGLMDSYDYQGEIETEDEDNESTPVDSAMLREEKGKLAFESVESSAPKALPQMGGKRGLPPPPPPPPGKVKPPLPQTKTTWENSGYQQPKPAKVKGILEPLIKDELAALVKQAVEEYCQNHFNSLVKEVITAEIRRLADERTRHLVDR
jgi:CheY-like chemotaxis protein